MTWAEFKRYAGKHGWVFVRHGRKHDIVNKLKQNDDTGYY